MSTKSGFSLAGIKTGLSRAKQKVMVKMGKSDDTVDAQFAQEKQHFDDAHKNMKRLQKAMNDYQKKLKELQLAHAELAAAFTAGFETTSPLYTACIAHEKSAGDIDAARNEWEGTWNLKLHEPLNEHLNQYKQVVERISERERRRVDMDRYRQDLKALMEKTGGSAHTKQQTAKEKYDAMSRAYNDLNCELIRDMPILVEDRLIFLEPLLANAIDGETRIFERGSDSLRSLSSYVDSVDRDAATRHTGVITDKEESYYSKPIYQPLFGEDALAPVAATSQNASGNYGAPPAESGNYGAPHTEGGYGGGPTPGGYGGDRPPVSGGPPSGGYGGPPPSGGYGGGPPPSGGYGGGPTPGGYGGGPPPSGGYGGGPPPSGGYGGAPPAGGGGGYGATAGAAMNAGRGALARGPPPAAVNAAGQSAFSAGRGAATAVVQGRGVQPPAGANALARQGSGQLANAGRAAASAGRAALPAPGGRGGPPPARPAAVVRARALYPFDAQDSTELPFQYNDVLIIHKQDGEWWEGEINGRRGLLPATYVQII